jgi:hypothetical protein
MGTVFWIQGNGSNTNYFEGLKLSKNVDTDLVDLVSYINSNKCVNTFGRSLNGLGFA